MSVPDYQSLMLPILERAADDGDHRVSDLIQELSDLLQLTEEDRDQRLASGQRTIFNRTHWAVTYLTKTGILSRSARGTVRITDRGREVLADKPRRIDIRYLSRYQNSRPFGPSQPDPRAAPLSRRRSIRPTRSLTARSENSERASRRTCSTVCWHRPQISSSNSSSTC